MHRSGSFRGLLRLLCWEAGLAVAYETWVSPTFLSALAGELHVDLRVVSVLAAVPWIGASGQILGAWAFDRSSTVKRYVLGMASLGRSLWGIPVLLAAYWGARAYGWGETFPKSHW